MDLRRGRGGRAWSEEEVARQEMRKARRRWQELRPGAQSSKLDRFRIFSSTFSQVGNGHEGEGGGDGKAGRGDAGEFLSKTFHLEKTLKTLRKFTGCG